MKKAILIAALTVFTFGAFAQTIQTSKDVASQDTTKKHKKHKKGSDTASKMLDTSKKM